MLINKILFKKKNYIIILIILKDIVYRSYDFFANFLIILLIRFVNKDNLRFYFL
jgi:hypothetical protein